MAAHAMAAARAAGVKPDVVYIPRPSATPAQIAKVEQTDTVAPLYNASPAPMGLAYYGLSGSGTGPPIATTLNTTALQGTVDVADVRGADLYQAAPDSFSIQLNAVLTNVTLLGTPGYTFWTQGIATYFPSTESLLLVTNIWNFSGAAISSNALEYTSLAEGAVDDFSDYGALGFYYSEATVGPVSEPFNLTLTMTSGLASDDYTTNSVTFGASVTSEDGSYSYPDLDQVVFNSVSPSSPESVLTPSPYTADGTQLNPLDLTDDFELVICGPGGGSNVDLGAANATLGLAYYDAESSSFVSVPAAYTYGGDTGESSIGANVAWSDAPGGPAGLADYGTMDTGPSILSGLWGTGAPEGTSPFTLNEKPANAFNFFVYHGTDSFSTPIVSQYEYAPSMDTTTFYLMPGSWSVRSELSGYSPSVSNFYLDPPPLSGSLHPGALDAYEVAGGGIGSESLDPSVCYATVCAEPITNVFETLVTYAGSNSSEFLPLLSTCVPGAGEFSPSSVSCQSLYGQSLVVDNVTTGLPQYWTFPIDQNARFYDPTTDASWSVYPSDVMFSFARTLSYADLPGSGVNPGWIQAQSLLPSGNPEWDGGIHAPYNNTPSNILGSMLVNDSAYCPAAALAANGCITFVANGGGTDWPFFLQLVAQPLGAAIQSCGWVSYEGAGLPGFPGTSVGGGDGPCWLPGDASTTSSAAFHSAVSAIGATGWDSYQMAADDTPVVEPKLQDAMVGSGPYYLANIVPVASYSLAANPAYAQPNCAGLASCYPSPRTYVPSVTVDWDGNDSPGISEYEAGEADFATISPSHTSTLLLLQSEGRIGFVDTPSFTEFFLPFDLNFNGEGEGYIDPVGGISIPSDFFSSISLRNFLTHAWPYATINATLNSLDGVSYGFNYGGPIPQFMGDFYPRNVSFPSTNPDPNPSDTGGAAWWWAQATNASSPYYDPQLTSCTVPAPCKFPIVGFEDEPTQDSAVALYISEIESLTGGVLEPYTFDLVGANLFGDAAQGDLPDYVAGWAPDYADPTDYLQPLLLPNGGLYTGGDSVSEQLASSQYNSPSCGYTSFNATLWTNLTYWANLGPIPSDCQGVAYSIAVSYGSWTDFQPLGAQRALAYNLVEHILNQLALYTWYYQANEVESYASWIDPATVNTNPMVGGSGEQLWFNIGEEGTLDVNLTVDVSAGVYTPLWAFDNSEVALLSQAGLGTALDPYVLINDQPAPLSSSFGLYNDYGFPVFPGVFLQDTNAWVELYEPPTFAADTNDSQYWGDDLPQTNDLQYWFWGVSHVALVDAANISGWFGAATYTPLYFNSFNAVFYDSENNLVGNDSFFTEGQGLLMYTQAYEPDYNTIWGNEFIQVDPPFGCPASGNCLALLPYEFGLGLEIGEDYDLVYNNLFATPTTAWLLPLNLVNGAPELYPDNQWNITSQPAKDVYYLVGGGALESTPSKTSGFPTFPLSGSIVGGTTQGGNSWWDQGISSNWDNGANNTHPKLYDENATTLLDPETGTATSSVALESTYPCNPTASYDSVPNGDYYCKTYIYGTTGGDNAPLATTTQSVSFQAQDLPPGGTWNAVVCGPSPKGPGGPSAKGPGGSPTSCGPSPKGPGGLPPGRASSESLVFTQFATTATQVNILAPPGLFYWSIPAAPPGETAENQLGSFTVTGTPSSPVPPAPVSTTLAPSYTETVTESGLPMGSVWWFNVTGRLPLSETVTSTTSTITDPLPNGTFSYVIRGPSGYAITSGSATGTFSVNGKNPAAISVTFQETTTPPALMVSPSAAPNPTEVDSLVTITAGDSGGVAPYTYDWSGLPNGCLSPGDLETFSCTPTESGTYTVSLTETDAVPGQEASGSVTLEVDGALTVSPSATPNPTQVGESTAIAAGDAGGVAPYTYVWSGLPTGCSNPGNVETFSCTPTGSGSYTISLSETDSIGSMVTGSFGLAVSAALAAPAISPSPTVIDHGQSATLTTTASFSGGNPPYTCQWLEEVPGASSYTDLGSSFTCTQGSPPAVSTGALSTVGAWHFKLEVTESKPPMSAVYSNVVTVTVAAALTVSPSATPNPTPVGGSTTISAGDSGGVGPYTYLWSGLPTACGSPTTESFACTPTVAGTYTVKLTEKDSVGGTASGTFTLVVGVAPAITISPSQGPIGATVNVTGSGFTPSSGATVTGDGVAVGPASCTVGSFSGTKITTSSSGSFLCTFKVPTVWAGTYSVVGHDLATGKSSTAHPFTVTTPTITVTPTLGPIGATVTVAGKGFSVSSAVGLAFDGVTVKSCLAGSSLMANSTGAFHCTFTVPTGTSGSTVTATDVGGQHAYGLFVVTTPKISVSPTQGPIGATVTVAGTGFTVSNTVTLSFLGISITSCKSGSLTTSGAGTFSCTFPVPSGTSGTMVTVTDLGSTPHDTASGTFTVTTPKITISASSGAPGSSVTVSGTGFSVSTALSSLNFDGVKITSCTKGSLTTNGMGAFSCTLAVPSGTTTSTVTATDVGGQVATATFKVT